MTEPEFFIKHMNKFTGLKISLVNELRAKFRPVIIEEQEKAWLDNSRSGCPNPSDAPVFKRVKLLNKFFLLNRAMRKYKNESVVEMDESKLKLSGRIKCNMNWPICLYDFTVRSRITNFFVFRVTKPVKVISNYFGEETEEKYTGGMKEFKYLFVPFANKEITIYDNNKNKRNKRMLSESK